MNEKIEVDVLHREGFSWVFQRTDRGMPSISIQGDSLAILTSHVQTALEAVRNGKTDLEELEFELEEAFNTLNYMNQVYRKYGWVDPPSRKTE